MTPEEGRFKWTSDFYLKSEVVVKEIKAKGIILGLHVGDDGSTYRVRYWHNGDPKTEYFYPWELEAARAETKKE